MTTVVRYDPYCQITANFPVRQSLNNGIIPKGVGWGGMPQKFYGADGNSSFAVGRKIYNKNEKEIWNSTTNGRYGPELIDAFKNKLPCCNNESIIKSQKNPGNRLFRHTQEVGKPVSGNKSIVTTSDEYIRRKKNIAIGSGSNPKTTESFGLKGIASSMTATQSRRKARSSGYIVPPKCRSHGGSGCAPLCCSTPAPNGGPVSRLF